MWAGYARRFISGYVPTLSAEDLTISRDRYTGIGVDEFPQREGDLKTLDMLACEDRQPNADGKWLGIEALGVLKGDIDDLGELFRKGWGIRHSRRLRRCRGR
jgi:CRISPR-associated protein Csm1